MGNGEGMRTGVLHAEPITRGDSGEVAPKMSSSVGKACAAMSQMVGRRYTAFGCIIV